MKIGSKILSIPPYISTAWSNISSLHVKEELGTFRLIVLLNDGERVEVPNLDRDSIDAIFNAHAQFEEEKSEIQTQKLSDFPLSFSLPMKGDGDVIESFGPTTQHNPEQADLPPLPPGILKKISAIASALGVEALPNLPKAEPGCNCVYCQVMKAVHGETEVEEEITEEDLRFRNWDVEQTADKLYLVKNPLDLNECYSVFLGKPIGCTCGDKNCEHVRAVLKT
jgi:hypothetical protein